MKLQELLKGIKPTSVIGGVDADITGVDIDSRQVKDGHLFVAMKGTQVDGHRFIPKAIEQGTVPCSAKTCRKRKPKASPTFRSPSTEDAVGHVATLFYGDPSKKPQTCRRDRY